MPHNTDIATRAAVVILKAASGKTTVEIAAILGLNKRRVNDIYARAIQRGFEPNAHPIVIRDEFVQDAPRSGRPPKQTEEAAEAAVAKQRRPRDLGHNDLEYSTQTGLPPVEAEEEAWVDTEDEEEAQIGPSIFARGNEYRYMEGSGIRT